MSWTGQEYRNINFEDIPKQIQNNDILKEVQELLLEQTKKGLEKYGTTVNIDDYSLLEWIDHVLQEKVDELVYLVTLKHKIKKVIG
jgi:hypothetical protein